jgi:adenine-specific DNA-methyltransferase
MLTRDLIRQIRALAAQGAGASSIATTLTVSPTTVRKYMHGDATIEVQRRIADRALTAAECAEALRLYRLNRCNAAEVARQLAARGLAVSYATVVRTIERALRDGAAPAPSADEDVPARRTQFVWPGREDVERRLRAMTLPKLRRVAGPKAPGDGHLVVVGDNVQSMLALREHGTRARLIYLDPPYGSGVRLGYADADAGDEWISSIYTCLRVARDMLAEDGLVVASISDRHVHHLRVLLDDVFRAASHVATITVQTVPGTELRRSAIASVHEYVVIYGGRAARRTSLRGVGDRAELVPDYYRHRDPHGTYGLFDLRATGSSWQNRHADRTFPLYVDPTSGGVSLTGDRAHSVVVAPEYRGAPTCWTWSRARIAERLHLLRGKLARTGFWRIHRKVYADEAPARVPTIWTDPAYLHRTGVDDCARSIGKVFDHPKPVALLRRLLDMTTSAKPAQVVLDVFAGSGALGQAVLEANGADAGARQYIGLQTAEPTRSGSLAEQSGYATIDQITVARLRAVIASLGARPEAKLGVWRVER